MPVARDEPTPESDREDRTRTQVHAPAEAALSPKKTGIWPSIPGYTILAELGRGGAGVVFKARQEALKRLVAIKMIHPERPVGPKELMRLQVEAEAVAQLRHPHIVQIHEVGSWRPDEATPPLPFLSLEFLEGGSLANHLDGTPWLPRDAAELIETLARAIHHAHEHGIVHRDLKPANILLGAVNPDTVAEAESARGRAFKLRDWVAKVADFGLAKRLADDVVQTKSGAILGTPCYMAPEQAAGRSKDSGPATDIYALGAILYELLTGRPPFKGVTTIETLQQVLHAEPVAPRRLQPQLSRDLETICLKCLDKEPRRRYASASALADDVNFFLTHRPIRARPVHALSRLSRWCRRNPVLSGACASAAAALLVALVLALSLAWSQSKAAKEMRVALAESDQRLADLTFERSQALCEQGDVGRGLLYLVRGMGIAHKADAVELERVFRTNLSGWSREVHPLRRLLAHQGRPHVLAFSPDGLRLATAGHNHLAQLWTVKSGEPTGPPLRHEAPVRAVVFSADGRLLLTGSADGSAWLWRTDADAQPLLFKGHTAPIEMVAFHSGGKTAATAAQDGTARLWDVTTGRLIGEPLRHAGPVRVATFSPDGRWLLTAGDDRTARLWDAATGKSASLTLQHASPIRCAAFSPDSRLVATGCEEDMAHIWETESGRPAGPPLAHFAAVKQVVFSSDGKMLLTASRDWTARLWLLPLKEGKLSPRILKHQGPVESVSFSPDGRLVLTGSLDGQARLWEVATGKTFGAPLQHPSQVHRVAFSPDGKTLATASYSTAVRLWELAPLPSRRRLPPENAVLCMAFSPDGRYLATGGENRQARLWDVATAQPVGEPLLHEDGVQTVSFGADARILVTGGDDKRVRLWDVARRELRGRPVVHPAKVTAAALNPDGRLLLTGTRAGRVYLWDTATTEQIADLNAHEDSVWCLAFSPNGQSFLSGGADHMARLCGTETRQPFGPSFVHQGQVKAAAFSPDGQLVATGGMDNIVRIWATNGCRSQGGPLTGPAPVQTVAFGPGGRTLLIGYWNNTSRMWDIATHKPVGPPLRHGGNLLAVHFDSQSHGFRTATEDNVLEQWEQPVPLTASAEQAALWVQVITGMELDDDSNARLLDDATWQERQRLLCSMP